MPLIFLERVPFPIKTYTAVSVALLSLSVYFAVQISSDPNWKLNHTSIIDVEESSQNDSNASIFPSWNKPQNGSIAHQLQEIAYFMFHEPLCICVSSIAVFFSFNVNLIITNLSSSCAQFINHMINIFQSYQMVIS